MTQEFDYKDYSGLNFIDDELGNLTLSSQLTQPDLPHQDSVLSFEDTEDLTQVKELPPHACAYV
jgi:hypothetical protein